MWTRIWPEIAEFGHLPSFESTLARYSQRDMSGDVGRAEELTRPDRLDYETLWAETTGLDSIEALRYFEQHLPYVCRDAYETRTRRPAVILRVRHATFEHVFDHYTSLEATGVVPYSQSEESRLVVALGRSAPKTRSRDDDRLRGWVGPTERAFGREWDKGHYIAHSLGGAVEGVEANVFVQRRDLNRGWSSEGKRFRQMEKYCLENAGTLCFARPIYVDGTSRAAWLEFGLIRQDGQLCVECFDNRATNR